ncbi:hypothetical protein D777_01391 [Marinobacter nitratireducens]|uniref:Enzyme involved in the deoxyxylulose pathway of isoprenoid biosynthesis n=1 Tax=Marinobacter nitratireducens TaxID=1137280 RepID=A0A072N675_9GAMM|nr:DUF3108 domain-containing protein [Marinobacter nitratireducens]KEF32757.1 hypothetical protein D777_01391 [Marinobacter nitratireducens]
MTRIRRLILSVLRATALPLALFSGTALATNNLPPVQPGLQPFEASYSATMDKGISLNGSAKRTLTSKGNGIWLYRTDVDSFIADIDESIILKWENDRVVPLRYRYRLSGFLIKDREESIDFDWSSGKATGRYKGKAFTLDLEPGTLDPLGFQLQLHQDIKAGKRDVTYRIIDGDNYDTDRFAVIDKEPLENNGQTHTTLKAEKVREENAKRQTLMWFAPDEGFMLMRLLQVEPDGSHYELRLKEAELGG